MKVFCRNRWLAFLLNRKQQKATRLNICFFICQRDSRSGFIVLYLVLQQLPIPTKIGYHKPFKYFRNSMMHTGNPLKRKKGVYIWASFEALSPLIYKNSTHGDSDTARSLVLHLLSLSLFFCFVLPSWRLVTIDGHLNQYPLITS